MKRLKRARCIEGAFLVCLASSVFVACDGEDARRLWTDVLQKCSNADHIGDNILYLGPTNRPGPGSVWRESADGGYHLVWRLADFEPDTAKQTYVDSGNLADCEGRSFSTSSVNAGVVLDSKLTPVEGGLGLNLSNARKVTVQVGSWRWDQLVEGPFLQRLADAGRDHSFFRSIRKENHLVAGKALRVMGVVADLEFSSERAADLRAEFSGGLGKLGDGRATVGVNAGWTNQTTLRIESTDDFYLVAEMWRYDENSEGFAELAPSFAKTVTVPPEARWVGDGDSEPNPAEGEN